MANRLKIAVYVLVKSLASAMGDQDQDGDMTWAMALLLSAHLADLFAIVVLVDPNLMRLIPRHRTEFLLLVGIIGVAYAAVVRKLVDEVDSLLRDDEVALVEAASHWRLPVFLYLLASWCAAAVAIVHLVARP